MKNQLWLTILLFFVQQISIAQQPTPNPATTSRCQNVFIWPIAVENARAEGSKVDVKRFIEAALSRIGGCIMLERDRLATLEEIAQTEAAIRHITQASKKVKTALRTAKAELVIFVSIEKAADGRLTINMALEEIETTQVVHTDTWTLTAEQSQESNLKESIYERVYELVHKGVKPPESPTIFEKAQKAKNDKKRIPQLCNYLDKGYKTHAKQAEQWLDNIMYAELRKSKREWFCGGAGVLVGTGLYAWGDNLDQKASELYETYERHTDPFDEVYLSTARADIFKQANRKRGGALTMKIGGGTVLLAGVFFIAKRISWQKTLKQGKKTLGISFVPGVETQGLVLAPVPLGGSIHVRF